jgi:hypothetical protein
MITGVSLKPAVAVALALALSGCSSLEMTLPFARDKPAAATGHAASPPLSEDEAKRKAGEILSNTEYGESAFDVISRIKAAEMVSSGATDCGPVHRPLWRFAFDAPHKGALFIDAVTGEKECSSLPFAR